MSEIEMKRVLIASAAVILLTPALSFAEKFQYTSKDKKTVYDFELPDSSSIEIIENNDGSPKVLGEGSMGIAFKISVDGEERVLKYFKTNESFTPQELQIYAELAKKYVLNPESMDKKSVSFLFDAPGAAEDIVFDAQQRTEKDNFDELVQKGIFGDWGDFGVGSVTVQSMSINVEVYSTKTKQTTSYRDVTALIKPLIQGTNLKEILEQDRLNDGMVRAIISELVLMSSHGIFYDDLNEANWFIDGNSIDGYIAIPFDMKPGRFVGSFERALKKNCKGVKKKTSPLGMSNGFLRNSLVSLKQKMGAGKFHAAISRNNKSIKLLKNALEKTMKPYQTNQYRPKKGYR